MRSAIQTYPPADDFTGLHVFPDWPTPPRWMLKLSDEGEKTGMPGYMVTLLAPTDSAVWEAMKKLGGWLWARSLWVRVVPG